jgi:hypothetical protein
MTPFFILSTPRSRGTLLMRMLDATPGVRCAGESSPLLERLRALDNLPGRLAMKYQGETWPMHRQQTEAARWSSSLASTLQAWVNPPPGSTHYGVRSSFLGREGWRDAVDWWSWILETWPDAKLILLGRDQGEVEVSMLSSPHLWRPHYGTCPGNCGGKVYNHLLSMQDFHELNSTNTVLLDAVELLDFDATSAALAQVGIPLARQAWETERASVSGTRKECSAIFNATVAKKAKRKEHPLFDPATTYKQALALTTPPVDPFEAWKLDPFGDAKDKALVAAFEPKKPRKFIEQRALHASAIVYPWLSTKAAWEELRFSLRSIEKHFIDRDCPIYILGDAPPPWLEPAGRVKFLPMDYSRSRTRGLHQAFATGLQIAERVLWMNDDIYLLKDAGWSDFETALTEGVLNAKVPKLLKSSNAWQRWLGECVLDLRQRGVETVHRFATHTPYLFERDKSLEILRGFHLPYKGGWVTRYHAWHKTAHEPCGRLKTNTLPAPHARFLNHNDKSLTPALRLAIAATFAEAAPWERTIPRVVHQTWKNRKIPRKVYPSAWTHSWKALHPKWEHRLWTDEDLLKLAETDYPEFAPLMRDARGVIKADVGRLLILHRHGGLYADLDYQALRPMDPLVTGTLHLCAYADGYTSNAIMAAVPGHGWLLEVARRALKRWKAKPTARPEWISGPDLLGAMTHGTSIDRWEPGDVCPHDWRTGTPRIKDPAAECPDAYAVTYWAHNW